MLFDLSNYRKRLPEGVLVFASGANQEAEIRGFARLGIPVGVSVNHLNSAAIAALIEIDHPVMIDSGAFSEVTFTDKGPQVLAPITEHDWRQRLSIYLHLALALREKAMLVAPDRVGDQQQTLNRLGTYRTELQAVAATGASLLIPLQVGAMSHVEFFEAAQLAAAVPLTPAMPMRKATTSIEDLLRFVGALQPRHVHLLGMGIDNRRAEKLIGAIRYFSSGTAISMDSNRLRAVAGRNRPLTRLETELRSSATTRLFGAVDSQVFALNGESVDYTDLIASPSYWAAAEQLSAIANAAGMTEHERSGFAAHPDQYLQSTICGTDSPTWMEHPLVSLELDRAWEQYVERRVRSGTRRAAIVGVFADARITGQTHCEQNETRLRGHYEIRLQRRRQGRGRSSRASRRLRDTRHCHRYGQTLSRDLRCAQCTCIFRALRETKEEEVERQFRSIPRDLRMLPQIVGVAMDLDDVHWFGMQDASSFPGASRRHSGRSSLQAPHRRHRRRHSRHARLLARRKTVRLRILRAAHHSRKLTLP